MGVLLICSSQPSMWRFSHNHNGLQDGKQTKLSFGQKRKAEDQDTEPESDNEEDVDFDDQSEEELDFGHGGPDVVGFASLQDALAALSRKFGSKAPPSTSQTKKDESKSFPPPNKS